MGDVQPQSALFNSRKGRHLALSAICVLALYATSYAVLSRQGIAEAREQQTYGFYFSSPFKNGTSTLHMFLWRFYEPALFIDKHLFGRQMDPGSWPLSLAE